jgi:uncharacterized protein
LKLHLAGGAGLNLFSGYGPGYVAVNGARHERSLVLFPGALESWAPDDFDALDAEDLAPLADRGLELVIVGTGARLRFPRPAILAPLAKAGVGVEVMDTQAACRTYNILVSEGRKVAAAVIVERRAVDATAAAETRDD